MNPRGHEFEWKGRSWRCCFALGDNTHQLSIGAKLAVNLGFAAHPLNARSESQSRNFENQSIARNDWPAKAGFLDARKEDQLFIPIRNFAQRQNRTALRECFDHAHTRHYRGAGKMALEKRFVGADLLDADDALKRGEFDDPIDEQKRIAMRQKFF